MSSNPTGRCVVALTDGEDNEHHQKTDPADVKRLYISHHIKLIIVAVDVDNATLKSLVSQPEYTARDNPNQIHAALSKGFSLANSGTVVMEQL